MAASSLSTLPNDVWFLITDYLDSSTLRNLALVDKQFNAIARNTLFRSIKIETINLTADVHVWRSFLQHASLLKSVRHLRVEGCKTNSVSHLTSQQEDIDFTPLAVLVAGLSGLTELTWACTQQFPPALLNILHRQLPSCRLHLEIFRLFGVFDPIHEAYERSLLSSPNLYAISEPDHRWTHNREPSEKIMRHVVGLAPNLRRLDSSSLGRSFLVSPEIVTRISPEHALLQPSDRQGSLECLHTMTTPHTVETLRRWMEATDFTKLRSLRASGTGNDQQLFKYMAERCNLENLDDLELYIAPLNNDGVATALASGAQMFLCNLGPLRSLQLAGDIDCAFLKPVLEVHGRRLRNLDVNPSVGGTRRFVWMNHVAGNAADLFLALSPCVQLEELTITVPRTRGNKDEVAVYRAIGSLPRLQRVNLLLDATDPAFYKDFDRFEASEQPTHDDFDAFDNEFLDDWSPEEGVGPRKGHIRHAFINSAIDRELVESIFWTIDGAKPFGSPTLEEVYFTMKPGGYTGDGVTSTGIIDMCKMMAQSWIVRRSPRDDRRHELESVTWAGDKKRLRLIASPPDEENITEDWESIRAPFRKLWPLKEGEHEGPKKWREQWHSFPLEA